MFPVSVLAKKKQLNIKIDQLAFRLSVIVRGYGSDQQCGAAQQACAQLPSSRDPASRLHVSDSYVSIRSNVPFKGFTTPQCSSCF